MSDEFDADFNAGFNDDDTATKPTPAPVEEVVAENQPVEGVVAENVEAPAAAEPAPVVKPKYAKITEEQLAQLVNQASESQKKFDTAFGKIGSLQQVIDQLKASTAAGTPVEISAEDFAELKQEYPELTEMTVKGMNKALSKMRGTAAPASPAQLEQLVQQRLAEETPKIMQDIEQKVELKLLARSHSDWKDVVNSQEFKTWLEKQPDTVRKAVAESWDSNVTIPIISSFKEQRKAAARTTQAANTRQQRLQAGVNPRGTGGHAPAPSEDDEFLAGFNSE